MSGTDNKHRQSSSLGSPELTKVESTPKSDKKESGLGYATTISSLVNTPPSSDRHDSSPGSSGGYSPGIQDAVAHHLGINLANATPSRTSVFNNTQPGRASKRGSPASQVASQGCFAGETLLMSVGDTAGQTVPRGDDTGDEPSTELNPTAMPRLSIPRRFYSARQKPRSVKLIASPEEATLAISHGGQQQQQQQQQQQLQPRSSVNSTQHSPLDSVNGTQPQFLHQAHNLSTEQKPAEEWLDTINTEVRSLTRHIKISGAAQQAKLYEIVTVLADIHKQQQKDSEALAKVLQARQDQNKKGLEGFVDGSLKFMAEMLLLCFLCIGILLQYQSYSAQAREIVH